MPYANEDAIIDTKLAFSLPEIIVKYRLQALSN